MIALFVVAHMFTTRGGAEGTEVGKKTAASGGGTSSAAPVAWENFGRKAVFRIYNNIGVEVESPARKSSSTLPVITGGTVTVVLSDLYELVSVQCHWDGVSEKSRYTYTIWHRLKGEETQTLYESSFDLARFETAYSADDDPYPSGQRGVFRTTIFTEMGVLPPRGGMVAFGSAPDALIMKGTDPSQF